MSLKNYDYKCPTCDFEGELLVDFEERDAQLCPQSQLRDGEFDVQCGWPGRTMLTRVEISGTASIDTKGGYQMKAIFGDGSKASGHFGKTARNKGSQWKP